MSVAAVLRMMPKLLPPARLYCFKKSDLNLIRSSVIHVTCTRVGICRLKGVEVFVLGIWSKQGEEEEDDSIRPTQLLLEEYMYQTWC